jgi:ComF family protein
VQKLVHALKYRGMTEVGRTIGERYGRELMSSPYYKDIELIIPVPLHPRKKKKRGYNQSEIFSQGLAKGMGLPVDNKQLLRQIASGTQTRKSRYSRWKNVEGIFSLNRPMALKGKNILLVDDVITTGATIEACAIALQQSDDVKIWVAAIGFASR